MEEHHTTPSQSKIEKRREYDRIRSKDPKRKKWAKEWYEKNKKEINERRRSKYNPEKEKEYKIKNAKKIKEQRKKRYDENKEKELTKNKKSYYKHREKRLKYSKEYKKERRKNDDVFKLTEYMGNRIRDCIRNNSHKKTSRSYILIGASPEEVKQHLESQFEKNMSWDNYGGFDDNSWHIDHIIPIDFFVKNFDFSNIEVQKAAFNYKNLQPMWAKENMSKKATLPNENYINNYLKEFNLCSCQF